MKTTYSILSFKSCIFLAAILIINSCKEKPKTDQIKTVPLTIIKNAKAEPVKEISLFDIGWTEAGHGDTVGFVSVSDVDTLKKDSLVIPDITGKKTEETQYLELKSNYRSRLLTSTGIKETDSLFIYDYSDDILLSFPVSALATVATLASEGNEDGPYTADDYALGFKVDRNLLAGLKSKYFSKTYVYIGRSNPFVRKQMRPIIWKKINTKEFPPVAIKKDEEQFISGFKLVGAYKFESDGFHYYLQEFSKKDESPSHHLVIVNDKNEVVFNTLYYESDGVSPAPINFSRQIYNEIPQWTGQLLSNEPKLILGFEYVDFGCPILPLLDGSGRYVKFNCDSRH